MPESRRVALFVSMATRLLHRHLTLYHRPEDASRVVFVLGDVPRSPALRLARCWELQDLYISHELPNIAGILAETLHFYDADFLIVEPDYEHPISAGVTQAVGGWVFRSDTPLRCPQRPRSISLRSARRPPRF